MSISSAKGLIKLEFCRQIFEKYSNIKYNEIRPVEAGLFHVDRRRDRQDESSSRFSQFLKAPTYVDKRSMLFKIYNFKHNYLFVVNYTHSDMFRL